MVPPPAAVATAVCLSEPSAPQAHIARIVIADEHPIFRDGLRRLLETAPGMRIVGDTDTAEATALVEALSPDILLLGWSAAAGAPLEAMRRTTAGRVAVRTILLTRWTDGPDVGTALRSGARGVLSRDTTTDTLFESIASVMAGHCWVGRERVSDLAAGIRQLDRARRQAKAFGLTPRELEIVRAIMSGDTNKAIARQFSISENTVKRHITHIFNKVGASSRVELALFAAHHQLVEMQ
jgi:two-component system, NarL family, nitrate/nitrite response regulator NarL